MITERWSGDFIIEKLVRDWKDDFSGWNYKVFIGLLYLSIWDVGFWF